MGGKVTKIIERRAAENNGRAEEPLLVNPETVIFDGDGTMYVMNEHAKLVSLTDFESSGGDDDDDDEDDESRVVTARATEVADLGIGRPLGGKFDGGGCLYFADAILGLARVCNLPKGGIPTKSRHSATSLRPVVELIASRVKLDDGSWSPIRYADDVDVGPRTGHVYFTDASDARPDRDPATGGGTWDVMYASIVEGLRGRRTGRLLRYKPETGEVDVLATGAAFANGVAVVDADERSVLYTSTFEAAVMRHRLGKDGDEEGMNVVGGGGGGGGMGMGAERVLDGFPGLLDGADCSFDRGMCYVAIPATVSAPMSAVFSLPPWPGRIVRSLLMMIPRGWAPTAEPYGGVAEISLGGDGESGGPVARITRIFQDPDGTDFSTITGVTERGGKLYLGCLHCDYLAVVSLD